MSRTHRLTIPLRRRDMDELGHLNQSVYHELLVEARAAIVETWPGAGPNGWVLARVEMDYRHEVRASDGSVEIVGGVERVGGRSVTVAQDVLLPGGTVAAQARTVLVAWDPDARGARDITAEERAGLEGDLAA